MRLFVGIRLEEPARSGVLAMREELVGVISRQGVRFVKPDKLHLTLSFLGEVAEDKVEALGAALFSAVVSVSAFDIEFTGLGAFPDERRPKVIWVGVGGALEALSNLQSAVAYASAAFAERQEDREYSPHLTLARVTPGSQVVGRLIQPLVRSTGSLGEMPVREVVLYQSTPDGTYVPLHEMPLVARPSRPYRAG